MGHVPHAAEDAADVDAEVVLPSFEAAIDGLDDVFRRHSIRQVDEQLRGVTSFSVHNAFDGFVFHEVVGNLLDA